jgi:hypothetical protein
VIGALAVTGASAATLGATPTGPTWAPSDESETSWSPAVVEPPPDEAEAPEPLDPASPPEPPSSDDPPEPPREASPPLSGEATVIGALAVTGASAAALGDVPTLLTWAPPDEPLTS